MKYFTTQSENRDLVENAAVISRGTAFSEQREARRWRSRMTTNITYPFENKHLKPLESKKHTILKMLKCKNEATKLLKIKDRAWLRFSKRTPIEPIFYANEPNLTCTRPVCLAGLVAYRGNGSPSLLGGRLGAFRQNKAVMCMKTQGEFRRRRISCSRSGS